MKKANATPATCPTCHSTHRSKKEGTRTIDFNSIQIVNGIQCTAIKISYVTCSNCGQRYVVREPVFNGKCSPCEQDDSKID